MKHSFSFLRALFSVCVISILMSFSISAQWSRSAPNVYLTNSTDKVGIGISNPSEKLHINGSVRGNQNGGALRINTSFGYLDIGPRTSSFSHFITDRSLYYFNKEVRINSGKIGSYDEDLQLCTIGNIGLTLKTNGNVGIGTTSPAYKLDVMGDINFTGELRYQGAPVEFGGGGDSYWISGSGGIYYNGGNVGIGTTSPLSNLHICSDNDFPEIRLHHRVSIAPGMWAHHIFLILNNENELIFKSPQQMVVPYAALLESNGNLTISGQFTTNQIISNGDMTVDGKITAQDELIVNGDIKAYEDLTVDGKITAQEIEVKTDVWSDEVFKPDYNLRTLTEMEEFIKTYNHLPGVPSETEVLENGVNLGEMDALLLKKIEELTLYVIELEKKIKSLQELVNK